MWQRHSFSHSSSRSHQRGQSLPVSAIHFECIKKKLPSSHRQPLTASHHCCLSPKPPSSASGVPAWVLAPRPSLCTLSAASPSVLLRAESVHASCLRESLRGEAHVPEPVCPGQTLMPRHPVSPAQLHCTAAAFPACYPSSDPRAFAPAVPPVWRARPPA